MSQPSNIPCAHCGFDPTRTILYEVEVLVPFKWLSGNYIGPNARGRSGWKYKSYREGWRKAWSKYALKVIPAKTKRRLELTRVKGKWAQPIDQDNLTTGGKPLVDVLVDSGALLGDKPSQVERPPYTEEKSPDGKHYIRVKIIEFEGNGT